ncbi:hypothetical protein DPMN_169309 [Dreissena polymorpha]|uniref:Uncharacterized protein n=1 Tax=Dreissena polymorpha TaxID=45954 RepID=A0A9D4F506_DREPO|nr:hypothetical protein DPMN_169309 [Dreissena polymorpha]
MSLTETGTAIIKIKATITVAVTVITKIMANGFQAQGALLALAAHAVALGEVPVTSRKGWMTTMKEWRRWTDRWHLGKTRTGARWAGTPPGCSCEGTTYTSYNNK